MQTRDRYRLERHARRIDELHLWRNAREQKIDRWQFSGSDGATREMKLGDLWPEAAVPAHLWAETTIPEGWAGEPVELELWLGGEGFVRLSNGVTGGLDPFHRGFSVAEKAREDEPLQIEAEVVARSMFGSNISEPRLVRAHLVVPERDVRDLLRDLSVVSEACAALEDHEVVPHLLNAFDAATAVLSGAWPTATDVTIARHLKGYEEHIDDSVRGLPPHYARKALDVNWEGGKPWSLPLAPLPLEPLPEEAREVVRKARHVLHERLGRIKGRYPPVGSLALTGHAHLDLAWLWPIEETRRKVRRTFSSALGLMERYEDFTFNQSSAQLYAWVEEDYPEMFRRIKERVAQGRWEPVGGSWTEPDCQMIGGESFVRQLLYGQRYFETRFGRRSTVAWLPDTFGFSPAIPQLLKSAGMAGFFTYKLNWSESNEFPHDLFEWEGLDGSRVLAHTFKNPGADYNGDVSPDELFGTWRNFKGKRRHDESLFSFGWGDGGGGPTEKMLENYARLKNFPALPQLRMARVDEFFDSFTKEDLPRWVGELYLELHRGTLTTQGRIKALNREAEHRLLEAEAFAAIASLYGASYPAEKLEYAWKTLLLNQFHDILPGTSIAEVYEEAVPQLEGAVETAESVRDVALGSEPEPEEASVFTVANAALYPRTLTVVLPDADSISNVTDIEGKPLPVQRTEEGLLVHAPERPVPGLGWTMLSLDDKDGPPVAAPGAWAELLAGDARLENNLLRVEIGEDGTLRSVYDKKAAREVLAGRANRIQAYTDKPRQWDAWDIEADYESDSEELSGPVRLSVIEAGPLRAAVRVERNWRSSRIVQTYKLLAGSRRLDVETGIRWRERQVLLRALFPVRVRSQEATFETMYGAVKRPTLQNNAWDAARFEVAAHRYGDLSEPGYGVALLNDGKYGHSIRDNVLGISLLRSPLYPDPYADEGDHHFTYSLFPHPGDWTQAGVVGEAFALNSPLCAVPSYEGTGRPRHAGLVVVDGIELALGGLKKEEDGGALILRLYEPHGARGPCTLHFQTDVKKAEKVNLLEETGVGGLDVEDSTVRFEVEPFEVVTLRLEFEEGKIA